MTARTAERVMNPITHAASDAIWSRAYSAADASTSGRGSQTTSSRLDDEDSAVVLLSDELAASEAAPLVTHNAAKLAFCGGISGALAKTCTAPLARLTILYQVKALAVAGPGPAGQQLRLTAALRHVVATEGVTSLWKGNLVTIMHRIPYSATNFWTYESTKRALQGRVSNDAARAWTAGALSGLVACTAAYPLDLLRTRIAADSGGKGQPQHYRRIPSALRHILVDQGVLGLYKGLGATLAQVVPGLAFNFCFYDTFKRMALKQQQQQQQLLQQQQQRVQQHQQEQQQQQGGRWQEDSFSSWNDGSGGSGEAEGSARRGGTVAEAGAAAEALPSPSPLTSATCACLAGLCTSTITFPLDVVRRRLQVYERGALGRLRYGDVVRAVYAEGGVAAFYRGIGPEYAKVLPGMAIAFTTYEALKRLTGAA